MRYIPNKALYSAVMFALKMCPDLKCARDSKIGIAANYYHVDYADVLKIVREELWDKETQTAIANGGDSWHTIFNPDAHDILNTGWGNDFVFICPRCGRHYSCNINDYSASNKIFVSECLCGFSDEFQRKYVRKEIYAHLTQKEN